MNIKKLLLGGIAGGVSFFLLGWVIFGVLLVDFMTGHPGAAGNIHRAEPDFLYLIIGNLALGFLIAYIFVKGNVNGVASGLVTGGIVGLLVSVGYDSIIYATTTTMSKTAMAADVAAIAVMAAITGAVVAMVTGMGNKTAA